MRYPFVLLFLSLRLVALEAQSLQDSLLMHFRFDGDSLDAGPHQVRADLNDWNVPNPSPFIYTSDRFGIPNFAIEFHPLSNHIAEYVAEDTALLYPDFPVTFVSWMLIESHNTTNCFFHLNPAACFCSPHNEAFGGIWFEVRRNARKLSAGFGDGVNGYLLSHMRFREGTRELALHTWYHVAAVVRGPDDIELYINGKNDCGSYYGTGDSLDYCDECSGAGPQQYHGSISSSGNHHYWPGGPLGSFNSHMDGKLDDLRLWSRALSEQEIMLLQDLPSGVTVVDTTICQGDSLTLFGGYSDAYQWGPAAGLDCDTCAMPLATPQVTTTYRLFTDNGFGCVDTYSLRVFVEDCTLPACADVPLGASFSAVANGLTVSLSDQSGGQVDSLVFDLGNGAQLSGLPGQVLTYTYPQAGSYQVCLRAFAVLSPDSACVDSTCLTVLASPDPACDQFQVSVDFDQQVQGLSATFSDQSSGGSFDGVSWAFGDGTTQVGQPGGVVSHSYPGAGSYQVCLTVTDSLGGGDVCQSTECRILTLVDSATGSPTALRATDAWPIRVQPNPGHDALAVIQPQAQPIRITVFDAWGRQVWAGQSTRRSTRLDAAAWPTGLYLLRVQGAARQRTLRWWKR